MRFEEFAAADRVLPAAGVRARGSRWLIRLSAVGAAAAVAGVVAVLTLPGATRTGTAQTQTHIPNGPLPPARAQLTAREVLLRAVAGAAAASQGRGFQPQLVVPPGKAVSYDAVVAAGWTSSAPKLPPAAGQASVATQGKG